MRIAIIDDTELEIVDITERELDEDYHGSVSEYVESNYGLSAIGHEIEFGIVFRDKKGRTHYIDKYLEELGKSKKSK